MYVGAAEFTVAETSQPSRHDSKDLRLAPQVPLARKTPMVEVNAIHPNLSRPERQTHQNRQQGAE